MAKPSNADKRGHHGAKFVQRMTEPLKATIDRDLQRDRQLERIANERDSQDFIRRVLARSQR